MRPMTRKERFERALRREEVDRLPFWVKIFGPSYLDFQDERYRTMGELELADYLDLDHMAGGGAPVVGTNERVTHHTARENGRQVMTWETPEGVLTGVDGFDAGSHSWHPVEFPVKSADDLRAACWVFECNSFENNREAADRGRARVAAVGDRGIVMTGMGISPLMNLIQHWIGPENTYFFLQDCAEQMDELIEVMHQERLRYMRCLLEDCPYDYIVSVENTSTTLLSPAVFERYCRRHLEEYGRLIRERGKRHVLHMCGHLKVLLPSINELPADAIEAYTAPPVGNTTLADRVALCPDTAVIGGTDATLWLKPVEEICEAIERSLAQAGTMAGVVLTSAGVMTPLAPIEKIKQVREFARGLVP